MPEWPIDWAGVVALLAGALSAGIGAAAILAAVRPE